MRICIIKLGAAGDVVRTIPLAQALKDKYPHSHITWVTKEDMRELLEPLPFIDNVLTIPLTRSEEYDLLYNFDIDDEASEIAQKSKAVKKYGFYKNEGFLSTYNLGAEYYVNTVFDDELKRVNKKTYQEMMFEAAELPYNKERYDLVLTSHAREYAHQFKKQVKGKKVIGIHMGASPRWPSKVWAPEQIKSFIIKAKKAGYEILLFGGPQETSAQPALIADLAKQKITVLRNDPHNTKQEFAALMGICDTVVCSDSFALHVALGLGVKTVGLFFCTSYAEVEDYGLLKKIVSPLWSEFFPHRSNEYSSELVNSITADTVLKVIIDNKE